MKTVNTLMPPLEIPTKHGRANHAPQSRSRNRLGMSEDHLNHNTPPPRGLSDEDGGFSQQEEATYHNLSLTFTHNAIGSVKPRPCVQLRQSLGGERYGNVAAPESSGNK